MAPSLARSPAAGPPLQNRDESTRPARLEPLHNRLQSCLFRLLDEHAPVSGEATIELAVRTEAGVKVPDVVWLSDDRWAQIPDDAEASPLMPELCVEVRSEGNTDAEMAEKRQLHLEEGAQEVWICDEQGAFRVFGTDGGRSGSVLAPGAPGALDT